MKLFYGVKRILSVHFDTIEGMAMTLRLDPQLETELRLAAEEDRRSVHQTVVLAVETFLALPGNG